MNTYKIVISSKAQYDYKKLDKSVQTRIQKAILSLESDQTPAQSRGLTGKGLAQYRLRVGDYRILYDVYHADKTVLIIRIGHRKEIYR